MFAKQQIKRILNSKQRQPQHQAQLTMSTDPIKSPTQTLSIPLLPVISSNVGAVGYDPASQTLDVQFKAGGKVYRYAGVPPSVNEAMSGAESIGKFISSNIVKKFDFTVINSNAKPKEG
jgi:hypothetical protein